MSNLTKATIWVFIINITSKVLGLLRESVLAYKFGTSYIVDAYTIAITLPTVICTILIKGLAESYIPVASRINGNEKISVFTNNVVTIISCISVLLCILVYIFRGELVTVLAPGFNNESYDLAEQFIEIIILLIPVLAVFNIISAYLSLLERFIVINFTNFILVNIIVIASIFVASEEHLSVLPSGYVLSQVIPLIVIWLYAKKKTGFKYRPVFDIKSDDFIALIKLAIPLGASLMVNQINSVVGRMLASTQGEGIIAALSYADKIQLIFYSLTTAIFITLCYPRINKHFAEKKYSEGMSYVTKGFMLATWMGIPISVILFIFSKEIVCLILERGNFDYNSVVITAECLSFYAIGVVFYSYREVFSRALAANQKQHLILKNTAVSIALNIVLSLLLMNPLQHIGLALATSISGIISAVLMYNDARKIKVKILGKTESFDIIKIGIGTLFICIIMGFAINILANIMAYDAAVVVVFFIGALLYIALSYAMNIRIWMWISDKIFFKNRRKDYV